MRALAARFLLALPLALVLLAGTPARAQDFEASDEFPGPLISDRTVDFSNIGATVSPGEPLAPNTHSTVWLSFVPTRASVGVFVLGGDLPAHFTVYQGDTLSSLEEVASGNRSGTGRYAVVFRATPGELYHLQVASEGLNAPQGTLGIRFEESDPPPNDHFPGTPIPSVPFTTAVDTTWADAALDEPALFGATVWYSYTAPEAQRLLATFGPLDGAVPFDFRIAVYDSANLTIPGGRQVIHGPACDSVESSIVDVAAGETIWFQLGGAGFPGERGMGLFQLRAIAPGSTENPRCSLPPVSDLRAGTFFDTSRVLQDFYGVVLWEYDPSFGGVFELRSELVVGDRPVSQLDLVATLAAEPDGEYRYEFVFLVASSMRCYEVKPVLGDLGGPSRRVCLNAQTPRLPDGHAPEPPTPPPPLPPQAGNSAAARGHAASGAVTYTALLAGISVVCLAAWAARHPGRRL